MHTPFWAERLAHAVGVANVDGDGGRVRVRPGAPAEIADVVRIAGEIGAVIAVGENRAGDGVGAGERIVLDLGRMSSVLDLDETSLLVSAQAGVTFEALESLLAERSLTLGPLP